MNTVAAAAIPKRLFLVIFLSRHFLLALLPDQGPYRNGDGIWPGCATSSALGLGFTAIPTPLAAPN
jgi:hypothetical protein